MAPPLDAAGRRPILFGTEGFLVPGALASRMAELLEHGATRLRQNERTLDPDLAECITVARIAGQRYAESRLSGTSGIPQVDAPVTVGPEMMTTAQVATLSGCSERNVRALADRGVSLRGRRHPQKRGWFFHPDDVAAFLATREESS